MAAMPRATETAAPEDEPPGARGTSVIAALAGVPKLGLRPRPENASSDMVVLPRHTVPARVPRATRGQSRSGIRPRSSSDPPAVWIPAVS